VHLENLTRMLSFLLNFKPLCTSFQNTICFLTASVATERRCIPVRYKLNTLVHICYVEESRPPLRSSGQSSWLQIQRPGFDSRRYQIFLVVVGMERGPLSLVSTTEELLGRKSSGSGLGNRDYGHRGSAALTTGHRGSAALTTGHPISAKVCTNFA
jgi:hypothetical protein